MKIVLVLAVIASMSVSVFASAADKTIVCQGGDVFITAAVKYDAGVFEFPADPTAQMTYKGESSGEMKLSVAKAWVKSPGSPNDILSVVMVGANDESYLVVNHENGVENTGGATLQALVAFKADFYEEIAVQCELK